MGKGASSITHSLRCNFAMACPSAEPLIQRLCILAAGMLLAAHFLFIS